MITTLPAQIAALDAPLREIAARIFRMSVVRGHAMPPSAMEPWVAASFGDIQRVREQTIVNVTNLLTLEGALFNPLRALRPSGSQTSDTALERWIAAENAAGDFFADPLRDTTADRFGRVEGRYSISASNVAKYEGLHGLVIFAEPHPLRFTEEQLADYLDVALRWIAIAHEHDPQAIYPLITWNCLPRSGATIAHGHMQIALARDMHYVRIEAWRRAAERYRDQHNAHYLDDLYALHSALGLGIPAGELRGFAHLTPLRNREIVLLTPPRRGAFAGGLAQQLAAALFPLLRTMIDTQRMRSFNMAVALPPLATTEESWEDMGIVVRLSDRGDPLAIRNDWGAMELYATGCITVDPFDVAAQLRR
jgi:hypothetical protein